MLFPFNRPILSSLFSFIISALPAAEQNLMHDDSIDS